MRIRLLLLAAVVAASVGAAADDCVTGVRTATSLLSLDDLHSAVFGDFNEDGLTDIALVGSFSKQSILLNRGHSVFETVSSSVLINPGGETYYDASLAVARDVNGDGHVDLVFSDGGVELGTGHGTFAPLMVSAHWSVPIVGWGDHSQLIDLERDGRPEVLTWEPGRISAWSFLGDGSQSPKRTLAPAGLTVMDREFVVGDYDGDGFPDIYLQGSILFNDGHGGFGTAPVAVYHTSDMMPSIVLAGFDLDGDGADDLVMHESGALWLVRARGRSVVRTRLDAKLALDGGPLSFVGYADLDGDGKRDALFSSGLVVWGTSTPSRIDTTHYDLIFGPRVENGVQIADIDGDGRPDIVRGGERGVFAVYGRASGRPDAAGMIADGDYRGGSVFPPVFATGDINGDGIPDVVTSTQWRGLQTFLGDRNGGFAYAGAVDFNTLIGRTNIEGPLFLVDLDGDGKLDLVFGDPLTVLFGDGTGAFGSLQTFSGTSARDVSRGDHAVFQAAGSELRMLTFGSDRHPSSTVIPAAPGVSWSMFDLEGDGRAELIGPQRDSSGSVSSWQILKHTASGWESQSVPLPVLPALSWSQVDDLDGDGTPDLVGCNVTACVVMYATSGGFQRGGALPALSSRPVAIDVDGDGRRDLVSTSRYGTDPADFTAALVVLHNDGGGTFTPATPADIGAQSGLAVVTTAEGRPALLAVSYDGVESLHFGCVPPRMRVAVSPAQPTTADRPVILVNASSVGLHNSGIVVEEDGRMLAVNDKVLVNGAGTVTLPPLTAGRHLLTVRTGPLGTVAPDVTTVIAVTVVDPPSRKRAVRH